MTIDNGHLSEVLKLIFDWDKAIRTLERKFNSEYNLTLNQCRLILYIEDKNYVELSHIHSWLNIDKSTTTRMIRPLLVNGYIDKFYQFGDKRKIYLKISDTGLENVKEIKSEFNKMGKRILKQIPAGKRDLTFEMVNELVKVVG